MIATKQRKNERFTSRHKIETLRRDGETLIAQSEHVLEEMDKLGTTSQILCLLFVSSLEIEVVYSVFRKSLQGNVRQLYA